MDTTTSTVTDASNSISRLGVGAGVSLMGVGFGRGLDFIKQIAMARLLGPDLFGLYAMGWNLLRIVGILAPLGLQYGVVHFATPLRRKDDGAFKSVIFRSITISFLVGSALSLILIVLAPWITRELFKEPEFLPLFRLFTLMLPFMGALRVTAQATRISQRMQYAVYAEEITQTTVNLVLFLVFYALGWQLLGAIAATVLAFVAAFLVALFFLRKLFATSLATPARATINNKQLLAFSLPTVLSGMFGVVINRIDRLFLGYYWPSAEVGVYQAAAQISVIMALVLNAFTTILTPMIADRYHKGQMAELEALYRVNTKWGIYLVTPLVLVIAFAAEDIMGVLFGSEYVAGATALRILTAGQFVNIATGASGMLLVMTKHQLVWARISLAFLIINLTFNFVLVPRWGINGAATATALTIAMLFTTGLFFVRRLIHLWPYDRRYFKGIAAAGGVVVGLAAVQRLALAPLPNLVLSFAVAGIGFLGILLLLGLDVEDRMFIRSMRNRVGAP